MDQDHQRQTVRTDVAVLGGGTVYLLRPLTTAAEEWMDEHLPEDAATLGRNVAVEWRYLDDIVDGMRRDGLVVA